MVLKSVLNGEEIETKLSDTDVKALKSYFINTGADSVFMLKRSENDAAMLYSSESAALHSAARYHIDLTHRIDKADIEGTEAEGDDDPLGLEDEKGNKSKK